MTVHSSKPDKRICVLVRDANRMNTHLLAEALIRNGSFDVVQDESPEASAVTVDVALLAARDTAEVKIGDLVKQYRAKHPNSQVVMMLDKSTRELVLEAFLGGAHGIFCRDQSFTLLCRCIASVGAGQIWANNTEICYLLEALGRPVGIRLVDACGNVLLTQREQEVVRWTVEGLTNKEIAKLLKLSEHTVKNNLFRIFEKLGISNRVELILYSLRQVEAPFLSPNGNEERINSTDVFSIAESGNDNFGPLKIAESYRDGKGAPQDNVSAYMWYLIADATAAELQEKSNVGCAKLITRMSPKQIAEAERGARNWLEARSSRSPTQQLSRAPSTPQSAVVVALREGHSTNRIA